MTAQLRQGPLCRMMHTEAWAAKQVIWRLTDRQTDGWTDRKWHTWKCCGVTLVGRDEGPRPVVATLSNILVMKPLS